MYQKFVCLRDFPRGKFGVTVVADDTDPQVVHDIIAGNLRPLALNEVVPPPSPVEPVKTDAERIREAAHELTIRKIAKRAVGPAFKRLPKEKRTVGAWLKAIARNKSLEDFYEGGIVQKAPLDAGTGQTGGYVLPSVLMPELIGATLPSIVRSRAMRRRTADYVCQFPLVDSTTLQAAGTSASVGGIKLNWFADSATVSETAEPTMRQLELRPAQLAGYALLSRELLSDLDDNGLESAFIALCAKAINYYEDLAFLQGSGVGEPLGVINSSAAVTTLRNTAGTILAIDLQTMIGNLLPGSAGSAAFIVHPSTLPKITAINGWIPNGPLAYAGIPILTSDAVPTVGGRGDVVLADFSHYVIVDAMSKEALQAGQKRSLQVAISDQASNAIFSRGQLALIIQERVDGRPWLDKPITLQDGASQVSPFVVLQ